MNVTIVALLLGTNTMPGPLVEYVKAGRSHNYTLAISKAQLQEQEAQVNVALATLTPFVNVQGAYTRNQYPAVVKLPTSLVNGQAPTGSLTTITIQPYNQLSGTIALDIPLLNADGITRFAQARHGAAGAKAGEKATQADVDLSIIRAYYLVVASQGVSQAAQRAAKTSQEALDISQARLQAGAVNKLAVDRARVDLARAQQVVAESARTLGLAQRNLETLTGQPVAGDLPGAGQPVLPEHPEEFYVESAQKQRPEVLQAREAVAQASAARDQAWMQLVPTLTGDFVENLTNASGFVGHEGYWQLGVQLGWRLDPVGTPASVRKADAAMLEQENRLKQELDTVRDDVHTSLLDIAMYKARVDETAAETASATEALKLAQEQFSAGTATSLDLSSAQRDSFQAEASYAESQANLAASLLGLMQASGEPFLAEAESEKQ
jgi:outer membrane protein TolC